MVRDGQLVCDLCTQVYPASASERFGYKGQTFELDLCAPHVHKLGRVLEEFIAVARRVAADGTVSSAADRPPPAEA